MICFCGLTFTYVKKTRNLGITPDECKTKQQYNSKCSGSVKLHKSMQKKPNVFDF